MTCARADERLAGWARALAGTWLALLLALPSCSPPSEGRVDADTDGDGGTDGDLDIDVEPDGEADLEADLEPQTGLLATVEIQGGGSGIVVVEIVPAWEGGEARRFEVEVGEAIDLPDLTSGRYGVRAWLDEDRDGEWDGVWQESGEPTALLGVELPRRGMRLVLRRGVPQPVLDDSPHLLALYDAAWEMAADHVAAGTAENGFADHYLDEAFSDQIFQWDTCFMTLFGRYGLDAFPVMASLDNFYGVQRADGFICRVANETDGLPCEPTDPSDPMINPPLFAWVELLYVDQTADASRLPRALAVLSAYHDWIDRSVRTESGLYFTSLLGSGMDNAPREAAYDAWVDITAQQALGRRAMAELARVAGDEEEAARQASEAERICADVRDLLWDDDEGFFFDLGFDGAMLEDKTLASIWPLVAGCATPEQTRRVAAHLRDPSEHYRPHPFASTAADSAAFEPDGHYWRGGVWAPTNYAAIVALDQAGEQDLARDAAERHLRALWEVYEQFDPDDAQLAPDATGDGRSTLWELYAPDSMRPGTRWDDVYLGRQDFVGWTGLGPIALLLEQIVGLRASALDDTLTLRLTRTDRHGVLGYRFGDQLVDLVVAPRQGPASAATIEVETTDRFTLVVEAGGARSVFHLEEGASTVEVDPAESRVAASLGPFGPFEGHAVLGNGSIVAAWSDDDGSAEPPGAAHLYAGSFGIDLVRAGRTLVVADHEIARPARVGLDPFFAAYGEAPAGEAGRVAWRSFVGREDAVVVQGALAAGAGGSQAMLVPLVELRDPADIDAAVTLDEVGLDEDRGALWAEWSDGTAIALGSVPAPSSAQAGDLAASLIADGLTGEIEQGSGLALQIDLEAEDGTESPFVWALSVGTSRADALGTLDATLALEDPLAGAAALWEGFSPSSLCGRGARCEAAARNLYAARASSLGGEVPADLTGQFVTDGFPQLYPRDALMVARALALAGRTTEAWEIVHLWLGSGRAGPRPGELYARYDALGRAVDRGSGAPYDLPEWDSNGYVAALVERLGPEELSEDERRTLLEGLDFIVAQQDEEGLFSEGGIVEWVGRLPGTAMTSWVGLDAGTRLARAWGEPERAQAYLAAAGRIRGGLLRLFDLERMRLGDERDGALGFDSSALFGPAWGYPADPLADATYGWVLGNAIACGGGVRYFEGNSYGEDLFFFTTAAAAEHAVTIGDRSAAEDLVGWMLGATSRYGLAPERVYQDWSGASPASPLSWSAAELAVAAMALESAATGAVEAPELDGEVTSAEHRPFGPAVVDADGEPDLDGDPVALFASRGEAELDLALVVAGEIAGAADGTTYVFYLADEEGEGEVTVSERGTALTFCAAPDAVPGASARVVVDPSAGSCETGEALGGEFESLPCSGHAIGLRAIEARVSLGSIGLSGPLQVIAVRQGPAGEETLPAGGSLATDGRDGSVLVTFEVDASPVSSSLDPDAGIVVTLSGDRPELGSWAGDAIGLVDDASMGDQTAGDGIWTTTVRLEPRGSLSYKYLVGRVGDGSWAGVEFAGDNRLLWAQDANQTGRVRVRDTFGARGTALLDP